MRRVEDEDPDAHCSWCGILCTRSDHGDGCRSDGRRARAPVSNSAVSDARPGAEPALCPHRVGTLAAAFHGEELVVDEMETHDLRALVLVEVADDGVTDHLQERVEAIGLSDNRLPDSTGDIAAFRRLVDHEHDL